MSGKEKNKLSVKELIQGRRIWCNISGGLFCSCNAIRI